MTTGKLRSASYNIRKAKGLDRRRDPARTLAVINALEADVVVLQESDLRLGRRPTALPRKLIEKECDLGIASVAKNEASLGWHGNAVLLRPGYEVLEVSHIELPGLEPRGAVHVQIGGLASVSIVAVHLGLVRRERVRQLATIAAATRGQSPTVVAGDFNAWAKRLGCAPFEERFSVVSPGRCFHARRPISSLDRIAVSEGLTVADAGVEEGLLARGSSDHLPVWADLSIGVRHRSDGPESNSSLYSEGPDWHHFDRK